MLPGGGGVKTLPSRDDCPKARDHRTGLNAGCMSTGDSRPPLQQQPGPSLTPHEDRKRRKSRNIVKTPPPVRAAAGRSRIALIPVDKPAESVSILRRLKRRNLGVRHRLQAFSLVCTYRLYIPDGQIVWTSSSITPMNKSISMDKRTRGAP